ncbi:hypothetical protein ACP4OV_004374 [Aristida adscensionis]
MAYFTQEKMVLLLEAQHRTKKRRKNGVAFRSGSAILCPVIPSPFSPEYLVVGFVLAIRAHLWGSVSFWLLSVTPFPAVATVQNLGTRARVGQAHSVPISLVLASQLGMGRKRSRGFVDTALDDDDDDDGIASDNDDSTYVAPVTTNDSDSDVILIEDDASQSSESDEMNSVLYKRYLKELMNLEKIKSQLSKSLKLKVYHCVDAKEVGGIILCLEFLTNDSRMFCASCSHTMKLEEIDCSWP